MRAANGAVGLLGLLALALSTIGIYGTMALMVRRRRKEMGIRIALGATPVLVVRDVTRRAMLWTGVGIIAGMLGALAALRWLQTAFYDIKSFDLVAFIVAAALLAGTACAASWIPAARAARLDPLNSIRND
jgi:ABC-type antimicrobial peptide transport system permease subunit